MRARTGLRALLVVTVLLTVLGPPSGASATYIGSGAVFPSVSVGGEHVCGVRSDATVSCWGDDSFGRNTGTGSDGQLELHSD